jgi:hypothetical protein
VESGKTDKDSRGVAVETLKALIESKLMKNEVKRMQFKSHQVMFQKMPGM